MQKIKSLAFIGTFLALSAVSIVGGLASLLIFPAVGCLFYYVIKDRELRPEFQTMVTGAALYIVFIVWHIVLYDKTPFIHVLIYTLALMAAIEAWRFTVNSQSNIWGLMNLVVFWISLEYLMLVWLPFDISSWFIGTPLYLNNYVDEWMRYVGTQGFSLWVLIGGLILFKSVEEGFNIILLLVGVAFVGFFFIIHPGAHEELYAQGEWIGRTCVWISVLILAYSFVKRKTLRKNES